MSQNETSKIQFTLWGPLLEALRNYTDEACLRRDTYLTKVLSHEIEVLARQKGRNSDLSRSFIHAALKKLNCQMATFTLPVELIDRINQVCADKNLHRDCFFNRVLLLILPKNQKGLYEWLYASDDVTSEAWHLLLKNLDTAELAYGVFFSNLHTIRQSVSGDPLGMVREAIAAFRNIEGEDFDLLEDPLVQLIHPSRGFPLDQEQVDMTGFNVFLDETLIEGSASYAKPVSSII